MNSNVRPTAPEALVQRLNWIRSTCKIIIYTFLFFFLAGKDKNNCERNSFGEQAQWHFLFKKKKKVLQVLLTPLYFKQKKIE